MMKLDDGKQEVSPMTIDDALAEISQSKHCFVIWDNSMGEIQSVTPFAAQPSPMEMMATLGRLKGQGSVKGRFLESSNVTRLMLLKEAQESANFNTRGRILTEWSHLSVDELVTVLEEGNYKKPMGLNDSHIIAEHLWEVHRAEMTKPIQDRLRNLLGTGLLHEDAEKRIRLYLAALGGNEAHLKAVWRGDIPGRDCWSDSFTIMEGMAYVRTQDQEFIGELLPIFEMFIPFGGKFDTMINLGKIGPVAGQRAAEVIRTHVFDSEPYIIAVRDRVLLRLLDAADTWVTCGNCCYGRIHSEDSFGERPCSICLGIGYRPSDNTATHINTSQASPSLRQVPP